MARKLERPTPGPPSPVSSVEQQRPSSSPRRPPVTNVMLVGQQLAQAFGAAQALINRIPRDPDAAIRDLRRWYDRQHPDERDRLLWRCFLEAEQTYGHLHGAIEVARAALDAERLALIQVDVERNALATHPLPATVEDAATEPGVEPVRRYQSLGLERDARQAARAELERLLPAPEQTLGQLPDAIARVLETVVTIDREALVRRVRESGELEQLRSRFERLRAMTNTHGADIDEWSRRVGRPVRVPRIAFPWPPEPVWPALLGAPAEAPKLVWDDDRRPPSA
jgi:hypothetical protein